MKNCFSSADILLPDFTKFSGEAWSVIACDQHTGEPEYWSEAEKLVGGSPSALHLILPEVYLEETDRRLPRIFGTMEEYLRDVFCERKDCMIYLERTLADGSCRRGLVGKIDLECYDYKKGSETLIRATEGTVLERIPPRVAVRREAAIELPHVMLLIDDPQKTVIEPCIAKTANYELAYDFDLMLDGGHVRGYILDAQSVREIEGALDAIDQPLLFAVGDGNHSLASAKALYEEVKAELGDAAKDHPSRYALVEVVNLHDEALSFEPIYRVMFGVSPAAVVEALKAYAETLDGKGRAQSVEYVHAGGVGSIVFRHPNAELTVGTLQTFIDEYIATHEGVSVDYIHGVEVTERLASGEGAIGFLFDGMKKDQLFQTVISDGALPRKTFSMGHAEDKRYYLEARKIK